MEFGRLRNKNFVAFHQISHKLIACGNTDVEFNLVLIVHHGQNCRLNLFCIKHSQANAKLPIIGCYKTTHMTRVFIWKNNSPQEWEEISFSAFSKARRNGCFTGRFFVETVKMFRDEDDRIIMECSRKDFEKYQQEDRHSRYLQEHEKSRSIFPASHVGDRDGTEEGYQDTDLFVDESVDTAEQAIQNLLLEDLHQALLKLSPAERDFILSYYEMKIPNATCLAQR